jgi:uncharacterized membrane-anchored protein YhcB (DUF1043 family)
MELLIPQDQAIRILQDRLQELSAYNFNPKAWKDRTELDLKEIFGVLGGQWLQISGIHFDTFVVSDRARKLQEGRDTAQRLLKSYIEFIKEYSAGAAQIAQSRNDSYEQKYNQLLKNWNELIPDYNDLVKKYQAELDDTDKLLDELEEARQENQRLIDNTIQLDNVSVGRLWMGIRNLPAGQAIAVITLVAGLLISAFGLGRLVERTGANNDLYDLRTENTRLKTEKQSLQNQLDAQPKPKISGK